MSSVAVKKKNSYTFTIRILLHSCPRGGLILVKYPGDRSKASLLRSRY